MILNTFTLYYFWTSCIVFFVLILFILIFMPLPIIYSAVLHALCSILYTLSKMNNVVRALSKMNVCFSTLDSVLCLDNLLLFPYEKKKEDFMSFMFCFTFLFLSFFLSSSGCQLRNVKLRIEWTKGRKWDNTKIYIKQD